MTTHCDQNSYGCLLSTDCVQTYYFGASKRLRQVAKSERQPTWREKNKLTISLKGIHDQLSIINTSKLQIPRVIPPWFLNRYASHLTPIIHDIFQSSVNSGQVPKAWKEANITAIFKKGNRAETSNYRPISLTPVISKLLEHIIHSHIMKALNKSHPN